MSFIFYFILYNLTWCMFLLANFAIIYTGYNKYKLAQDGFWGKYHDIFDIFDILYNYHLSLFFWDWPRTKFETISDRIRRYMSETGYKYKVAKFVADILNRLDKGHIK